MAVRPILTAPDPRLKAVSTDVAKVDAEIRKLVDDMADSMYAADGIGLAAVQIGVAKRVIVMDLDQKERQEEPARLHQPEDPLGVGGKGDLRGRLPVGARNLGRCRAPGPHQSRISRPATASRQMLEADGMLATCLQHEMDHLEGVLFIDHLSRLKRGMAIKKLTKAKKLTELTA